MRDKIAQIVNEHETMNGVDHKGAADSIIAALPDMVVPLVWTRADLSAWGEISKTSCGIYNLAWTFEDYIGIEDTLFSVFFNGQEIYREMGIEDHNAKTAANAHHRAQIMAAFGVTL